MSTKTVVQNRILALVLALMLIIAMIPVNIISAGAATDEHKDDYTITVKDSEDELIDGVTVDYSVKVNGTEYLADKVTADDGVAIVKDMNTIDFSDSEIEVTLDAVLTKTGYETLVINNEKITEVNGNLDVLLIEKSEVIVKVKVKDTDESLVSDAEVSFSGYSSLEGKTKKGVFVAKLYQNEEYSVTVNKKGYKEYSATGLSFDQPADYDVTIEEKLIDDTFAFDIEDPDSIEYGDDTFVNTASCSNSTGAITYSVQSGDSVIVDTNTGAVTTMRAGTSTIQALLAETDDYKEAECTYDVTVINAADSGFTFADPGPIKRKYKENDTYTNVADGGSGTGEVTYAVTDGTAAEVNETTGELTILQAGTVEVTATRAADDKYDSISVTYTLIIDKSDQSDFEFRDISPEDQFITNKTFTNEAVGGNGKGKVYYSVIEGGEYARVTKSTSPAISLDKVGGPVVVKAIKAGDSNYNATSATYTFYIKKAHQAELNFETTVKTIVYSPSLTYSNPLSGGSGTGAVTYEILSGDAATIDENTGVLTILKASDDDGVVVKATKAGDDNYLEQSAEFKLIINKAKQTGFEFADGETVSRKWSSDENTYTNVLSDGQSTGEVEYSVVSISEMPYGGPCASFDDESAVVTMYGKGTITVKAVKDGDDCYNPAEAQYTLTIERADQIGFDFGTSVPDKLKYNDNGNTFTLSTVGGSGSGAVSYSIESGDAVSINKNKVTVLKSGNVVLRATKADTNTYDTATVTKNITIEKADQLIAFDDTTTSSVVYGNEFTNKAKEVVNTDVPDGKGYAAHTEITYSVTEGENIVSVDNAGKLSFKNNVSGRVTIIAFKGGDECYNDTEASYSIDVVFIDTPENPYTLSGAKLNDSGWYTGDVTITPAAGYKISFSNDLSDNEWSDKLVVSDEGLNAKTIYLRNDAGISGGINIPKNDIRIDKTIPKNLSISYSTPVLSTILEGISFGFYKAPVTVTITADDDYSFVDSFEYSYGESETITIDSSEIEYSADNKTASYSFNIPAQFKGNVSFKAVDTAGNFAEKHDEKVIVVDDIAPGVTVSYDNNTAENISYYSSDRTATITIDEANIFTDAFNKVENTDVDPASSVDEHLVITVKKTDNNNAVDTKVLKNDDLTTPFTKDGDVWAATLLFDEEADYEWSIEYKDFSGNTAGKFEDSFTIDKTAPELSVEYDNNDALNDNYYKANRTATFTVVEHNFRPVDIVVESFTATDVQGESVKAAELQDALRSGKWNSEGDLHTLTVPFDVDADYHFEVVYSDLAGNAQTQPITDTFTVDKAAPANLKVSYSTSVIDTVLSAITFGFYNAPATVTIEADDVTSGVEYFTYSYGVQVGASTVNVGAEDTVINKGDILYSDNNKHATATFVIPAQFRGSVSFTATDYAGNTSDAFNDEKVIVVDEIAPGVSVNYDNNNPINTTYYFADRTATITIDEANFFTDAFNKVDNTAVDPASQVDEHLVITVKKVLNDGTETTTVYKNSELTTPFVKADDEKDLWAATLLFDEDADYEWSIEYKDFSGNTAGKFVDSFTIDKTAPELSIEYDNNDVLNDNYYKAKRTATFTVVEHNFRKSDIVVQSITAKDVAGNDVGISRNYQDLLRTGTWTDNGDNHTITLPFDVDANYVFEIIYSDLAGNAQTESVKDDFTVDTVAPDGLKISYSTSVLDTVLSALTFGFYDAPATVTIEADDITSGVDYFTYSYEVSEGVSDVNKGKSNVVIAADDIEYSENGKHAKAAFVIPGQFRGNVSFTATDRSGNTSGDQKDEKSIIVDTVAPGVTVSFDNNNVRNNTYYSADRTATIRIKEANFFTEAFEKTDDTSVDPAAQIDEHLVITVNKVLTDGSDTTTVFKNEDLTTPFEKAVDEKDTWTASLLFDENADYTLSIEYKDFSGNKADKYETSFTIDKTDPVLSIVYDNNEALNNSFYKANRNATLKVVEHNFRSSDVVVKSLTAKDVTGTDVDLAKDYQDIIRNGIWTDIGDSHYATIPFDVDANYEFEFIYSDLASNSQAQIISDKFTVDKVAPVDLKVSYSTSVMDTILEAITFGFYDAPATVTIEADDITSGVDYFTYSYEVSEGASDVNKGESDVVIATGDIDYSDNNKHAKATFTIPEQFRGKVSFTATDRAGNTSDPLSDEKVIVVDDIIPGLSVSYDNNDADNETYYSADRTATIQINEANFFTEAFDKVNNTAVDPVAELEEHLVITVTKTDNDGVSETKVFKNADLTTPFTKDGDVWTATLLFGEDADYTWSIEYKDFSGNTAAKYETSFTVDKTQPVLSVAYDNNDSLNTNHYKADRTATITIEEHNFRPSDIVVNTISAKDIQGSDVDYGKDYEKLLREGEWKHSGNTHTLEIPFDVDARYNYTFSYSDLAGNAETAVITDEFCVDKVAPVDLKVSYSTSVMDTILEAITFGFYDSPATVTLEADDITSGVDYFTYSYEVSEGASDVNKGESDVVIATGDIDYSDNNKHAKATFTIPEQFRGKVSFTATDRAGNTSNSLNDEKVIVVDSLVPGLSVSYDNNSAVNDTYYNTARTATIKIDEANFFTEAFDKVDNIAVDPVAVIDEHLVITVTEKDNNNVSTTYNVKNDSLTTPFVKDGDTWTATLEFANDADYTWSIEYKDFSGNTAGRFEDSFTVDNINPIINVDHANNSVKNDRYFKADRPATITITEHNFRAKDVVVTVKADKNTGKVMDYSKYLKDPDNWTTTGDVHTANISFTTEAYYTFGISYKDMSGRNNEPVNYGDSVAPENFVIDKTAPTKADITINNESILPKNGVAFEKFYKSTAVVKYSVNCDISGLDNITYQKVDSLSAYSENAMWTPFKDSVNVSPSEKFIIFFKAEDKSGNYTIVNSTGVVVDDKAPEGERYAPDIDIEPSAANENGLHKSDVSVDLKVVEPRYYGQSKTANGYYSGINKITYRIYTKDTTASQSGTLLDIANGITSGAEFDGDHLINKWTGKINVSAETFNSNNVIVEIYAVDNVGNERITTNEMISKPISIDVTAPSIDVSYQDGSDNGDSTFADSTNGAYFKNDRTATIVITERNFDPEKVKITATKDGQQYNPSLSWSTSTGGGNGDGTTHTATIVYSSDGVYTFDISFTDQAGNSNTAVNYGSYLSPQTFTIDKTSPVFSISYDNNSALNGNYYKADRTATLTIEEHNFEESRVNITLNATDNGGNASVPSINGWSTGSDTHTATITYSSDAYYTFDIEYSDKAGNALAEDYQQDTFYVDKTVPKVSITRIVDESANNDPGNIGFTITATDTNFDVFTPVITALVRDGNGGFVRKQIDPGSYSTITNGKVYTVTNIDADGVYSITCTVIDKAGNAYDAVTLSKDRNDKETEEVKRSGEDTLLKFSVNREGSTFDIDNNTIELLERYYVQEVDNDVVIDEINADTLEQKQVTVNGEKLEESEYSVEQSGGKDNWYKYTYKIDKSVFADEGEYNVVVSSKDRATNDAFSDVKNANVQFVVDRTAPVVTVTGLANNGRYQTDVQTVTVVPTDDGGELKSILVTLINNEGQDDKELLNLSDDNFLRALEEGDGKVTFEIPEGLYQNVRIICDDKAYFGDHENILYDETFTDVSVTPSAFLIYWANKPLRYGTIGGVVLLAGGIAALIILKKRKKKTPAAK